MAKSIDKEKKGKKRTRSDEKWKEGRRGSLRDVDLWGGELERGWEGPRDRADLLAEPLGQWFTCFPPHWQVLILLNVQHDLQAIAGAPFHGDEPGLPVLPRVEGVALPIAGEDLQERTWG